jgi:hypothetical protein
VTGSQRWAGRQPGAIAWVADSIPAGDGDAVCLE